MKYLLTIILFIALTSAVPAQTAPKTDQTPPVATTEPTITVVTSIETPPVATTVTIPPLPMKIVPFPGDKFSTEIMAAGSKRVVKNAPFSAEGISESVQVLEDGNRIKRSHTTKMYRDGEGRFRRETTGSTGGSGFGYSTSNGVISTYGFEDTISIFDPVAGVSYSLNPKDKTARTFNVMIAPGKGVYTVNGSTLSPAMKAEIETKVKEAKEKAKDKDEKKVEVRVEAKPNVVVVPGNTGMGFGLGGGGGLFDKDAKTEQLGTKNMEGVEVEGTRTVKTIPAGTIGNERDIEITYERWYSKDLDVIVYSRHYDPRSGEQIYKLTNIARGEQDRSLFTVPSDYTIKESSMKSFTYTTPPVQTTKPQ